MLLNSFSFWGNPYGNGNYIITLLDDLATALIKSTLKGSIITRDKVLEICGYVGLCSLYWKQTLNTKVANKLKRKCICSNFNTKIVSALTAEFLDRW